MGWQEWEGGGPSGAYEISNLAYLHSRGGSRDLFAGHCIHSAGRYLGPPGDRQDSRTPWFVCLFCNFSGQSQGDFDFDESITADGVFTWQSQPKQQLTDPTIEKLIDHDDQTDSIYLFLRTKANAAYTYCGVLGYLTHDEERHQPVHFQWQFLVDWPAPSATVADMGLVLAPTDADRSTSSAVGTGATEAPLLTFALDEEPPPSGTTPGATKTPAFKGVKRALRPDQDAVTKPLDWLARNLYWRRNVVGSRLPDAPT